MVTNKKLTIIIIPLFLSFLSCFASASDDTNLSKTGFYSQPGAVIKKLSNKKAGYKEHFLLGISYKKTGNKKNAIHHFANSCFKYSINRKLKLYPSPVYKYVNGFHIKSGLYGDSIYEIASLFYDYREFKYAVKFVELIDESGTGLYRDAALLKANALMELEKYDDAISYLKKISEKFKDINSRSLILIRIASAYEKKNSFEQAVREYFEILKLDKKSWQSGIACKRIIGISSGKNLTFDTDEKILLGLSLYHNSKKDSIEFLEELHNTGSVEIKKKILQYLINAYISKRMYNKADRLLLHYKNNKSIYYELLKTKADALWSANRRRQAFNVYKKIYQNAKGDLQKESHKKIASYLLSKNANYKDILIKYKDKYPGDKATYIYLWNLAKDSLKDKDYNTAVKFLEESLSNSPANPYSGKKRYWLVKLYSELNRDNDAEMTLKEMVRINPDSSYTWKALERIQGKYKTSDSILKFEQATKSKNAEESLFYNALLLFKEKNFSKRNERIKSLNFINDLVEYKTIERILNEPEFSPDYEHTLRSIEKYFAIGYSDGIFREISMIPDKDEYQTDKYKALACYGSKYKNYYFASVSILNLFKQIKIRENITILPVSVIKLLYPEAFKEHVEKYSAEYETDKNIIYAMIKAESSFKPSAVSPAGATGLMQLMPATAAEIARGISSREFDLKKTNKRNTSYLKIPEISILFGVKYFSWLNKYLDGDFVSIIAGYNAGPGNARKWLKELEENNNSYDEDFFIEFIPFRETLHYVLRIQKYFILYNLIYGENKNE